MDVGIFFFRMGLGGGTTTFTAHLFKALTAAGASPTVYRVKERGEQTLRPFGQYGGVQYQNITFTQAKWVVRHMPTVMAAPENPKHLVQPDLITRLMKLGMRVVIHDPNEFKIFEHLKEGKLPTRPICIRPSMKRFYPSAVWIPHPYMRVGKIAQDYYTHEKHAVSVARIASVKRPKIILEANRKLPLKLRVELRGAEHRLYTYGLKEKYGDVFKQSGKTFQFPMTFRAPVDICGEYKYNVDMTYFPDDGGGTQYAQMEAMDAGTLNIMHEDWFRVKGELRDYHVATVDSPQALVDMLKHEMGNDEYEGYVNEGFKLLEAHEPRRVGKLYLKEMCRD